MPRNCNVTNINEHAKKPKPRDSGWVGVSCLYSKKWRRKLATPGSMALTLVAFRTRTLLDEFQIRKAATLRQEARWGDGAPPVCGTSTLQQGWDTDL